MSKYWKDIFVVMDLLSAPYKPKYTKWIVLNQDDLCRAPPGSRIGDTIEERLPEEFHVIR